MGFFGMLFWIAVVWLVIRAWRRSHRCETVGPRGYFPGWYGRERMRERMEDRYAGEAPRADSRQEYIESLETRVSELEERLDFTERLLANRRESA